MQTPLSFMFAQSEFSLDEALLTFATVLNGDSFLGNDQVGFEVGADAGSEGELARRELFIQFDEVAVPKAFLATPIEVFQAISLWCVRVEAEDCACVFTRSVFTVDAGAIQQ